MPAAVADEIDAIAGGPVGREIGVSFGHALPSGTVGVDDPQLLLRQCLLLLRLWLKDGAEGELHAIGAPSGADDGGVGADGHLRVPPWLAIDQIERPNAEPARPALAGALESDAIDIAARAPGRKESRPQRFLLSAGKIQQPDLPLAAVGKRAIGQARAIGGKSWMKVLGGAA